MRGEYDDSLIQTALVERIYGPMTRAEALGLEAQNQVELWWLQLWDPAVSTLLFCAALKCNPSSET